MSGTTHRVRVRAALLAAALAGSASAADTGGAVDCAQPPANGVERRVCSDPALAALDRQLAAAYQAATAATTGAAGERLAAAQRAWVTTRNDCWRSPAVPACIEGAYRDRISELQARYRLLPPTATTRYQCPASPPQEATAEFFPTEPPTAVVTYAGEMQVMRLVPSGSGTRYRSDKRHLWEFPGGTLLLWDLRVGEMKCTRQ